MNITDRMGGFVSVRVIETKNIDQFSVTGENAKITLLPGQQFLEIISKKEGINPAISVTEEKPGQLFSINLQISAKNHTGLKLIPFNQFIAICKNPLGTEYVLGSKKFPLTGRKQPIFSATADGEMGELIVFKGNQPFFPPILTT